MGGDLTGLIISIFFIAFPVFWLFVVWLISTMSGWQVLVRHYEYQDKNPDLNALFRWQSLSMGYIRLFPANYSNVVNVGCDETYLYLSLMFIFRAGHKPLRIPFADIEISDAKLSLLSTKCIVAEKAPKVKIYLRRGLVKKIEQGFISA